MEFSMKKNYVLDTNVLIQLPSALYSFEEHNVVLPIAANAKIAEGRTPVCSVTD